MSTPTAVSRSNPVTPPTVNRSAATSPHRGSALWDDLNPSVGGTVSWKDTGQSIVVTYENVPEYSTSNDNTFQIEFFDSGDLRLSWLNIDLADAVVGLSAGTGSDPDFLPTDLSGLTTGCGPQPPNATSLVFSTTPGTIVDILLEGTDDGLPDPPGALTYVIDSLPIQPLRHMVTGALLTSADLPYIMPPGIQPRFNYEPQSAWEGEDTFSWHVDDGGEAPDGGSSPQAYVDITVSTGPQAIHVFTMDTDPGWVGEGGGPGANRWVTGDNTEIPIRHRVPPVPMSSATTSPVTTPIPCPSMQ